MNDAIVFSVLSKCFAPLEAAEWDALTARTSWSDFLDQVRGLLQSEGSFGVERAPAARARKQSPLQDFLTTDEVRSLFVPPSFEERAKFFARHFTGGLPASALPVESLYVDWTQRSRKQAPFVRGEGLYLADSAQYMRDLIARMGLELPSEFEACPDHLALELDMAAVLLRSGMVDEARRFVTERFAWLTAYRMRLIELGEEASFYIGLIDVVLGIREQLDSRLVER